MRILYNIASRSRPKAFFEVLDNIREMSNNNNYEVLVKLDDDDPLFQEYTKKLSYYYGEVIGQAGSSKSKIDAINRNINNPHTCKDWNIIINISDDQRFTIKGFDDIIRTHIKDAGFLHFPDNYKRAACSTMSIMSRAYYEQVGYIYHPDYYSLWADVEATEYAKLQNAYKYVPIIIHEHLHYSTTNAVKDSLYKRNDTYKSDKAVYERRRVDNFGLATPKLPFLLIKYPTRGRWRLFAETIDNIYSTIRTNQFHIRVSADIDDVEMNSPEVRDIIKRYHNISIDYGEPISKVHACNRHMCIGWEWLLLMSDDMRFTEFGWDYKMQEVIQSVWPVGFDWFAHFNDGYVGERLPTMNVCGVNYYKRFDYIYHPSYKSVSCDAENMFVAQMLGRYQYFDQCYFKHLHPANLKEPSDHIYRRNHSYGEADTVNYFARLKRLFDVADPVMIPEQMKPWL